MSKPYINRFTGEEQYFQNTNAFILFTDSIAWFYGYILNRNNTSRTIIPKKNLFFCSLFIVVSTLSFTSAIYITSYPMVTMIKSCNILSVLIVGVFCSRVKDSTQKIGAKKLITGVIITIGILLYNFGGNK